MRVVRHWAWGILVVVLVSGCYESIPASEELDSGSDVIHDPASEVRSDPRTDVAPDTSSDPQPDWDPDEDILVFCEQVCTECFAAGTPWMSRPGDECVPECADDFVDCSDEDTADILLCTGGPGCPVGPMGFATCVAPYTCLLS